MIQQGQVFKLKATGVVGQPLWAYRYRLEGRGSARPQVGGFATRAEALKVSLLDALAIERAVDAGWTSPANAWNLACQHGFKARRTRSRKPVDVR